MARIDSYDREAPRPITGTLWAWEPNAPHAACLIKVTDVRWNGEEWHVGAQVIAGAPGTEVSGSTWWNDLSRFWEACHHVGPRPGPWNAVGVSYAIRRGRPRDEELSEGGKHG